MALVVLEGATAFDGIEMPGRELESRPLINERLQAVTSPFGNAASAACQVLPHYAAVIAEKSWRALRTLQPMAATIAPISAWIAASAWLQYGLTVQPQPSPANQELEACTRQLTLADVPLPQPAHIAELSLPPMPESSAPFLTQTRSVDTTLTLRECYDLVAYENLSSWMTQIVEHSNARDLRSNTRLRAEMGTLALTSTLIVATIALAPILNTRVRQWMNRNADASSANATPEQRLERLCHFLGRAFKHTARATASGLVSVLMSGVSYLATLPTAWQSRQASDFLPLPFCQLHEQGLPPSAIQALGYPSSSPTDCAAQAQQRLSLVDFQADYRSHDVARQWLTLSLCAFLIAAFTTIANITAFSMANRGIR